MTSATDYITYFGVPIAVLGVMPIIYNTIVTLITLAKVRRILRHSRLAGIARGDIVNHMIEVELPRYTIAPLYRSEFSSRYWQLSDHPSLITGGSWTRFNWRCHNTGSKTQRLDYSDQLRQPQAEIGFEELVSFLLDLGAVPDATGFRMLRASGLWIPTGTPLLVSPDTLEPVLTIAPLDDSDGYLSLAVRWEESWEMRDSSCLPPYWALVQGPVQSSHSSETEDNKDFSEKLPFRASTTSIHEKIPIAGSNSYENDPVTEISSINEKIPTFKIASTSPQKSAKYIPLNTTPPAIRCQVSSAGLVTSIHDSASLSTSTSLPISHLLISSQLSTPSTAGTWFASALTALLTTSSSSNSTPLWSYAPPPSLLSFALQPTIPCGVLVLLSLCSLTSTPEWATSYSSDADEAREETFHKMRDTNRDMMRENALSGAAKAAAIRERMARNHEEWVDGLKAKQRREVERKEKRVQEAVLSPRWDARWVAEYTLVWLKENSGGQIHDQGLTRPSDQEPSDQEDATAATSETVSGTPQTRPRPQAQIHIPPTASFHSVVHLILHHLILSPSFALSLSSLLTRWQEFSSTGGLKKADYLYLSENTEMFTYATLLVAVVAEFAATQNQNRGEASLAMDVRECVGVWKRVRLG